MNKSSDRKSAKPINKPNAVPLTGMQRWFSEVLGESISVRTLEYGAHLGVLIWTALSLAAIIYTIHWLLWGPLILLLIACVTLYGALIRKGHVLASDPTEELEWYQEPFWNGMLVTARAMKWTGYDSSKRDRIVIDRRHAPVSDSQLSKLPNLAGCEVLDLEGSPVTDKSLKTIIKLKTLCCLVIRDTDISDDGVDTLIRAMPKVWIWY